METEVSSASWLQTAASCQPQPDPTVSRQALICVGGHKEDCLGGGHVFDGRRVRGQGTETWGTAVLLAISGFSILALNPRGFM
jgi:hypothetical protein